MKTKLVLSAFALFAVVAHAADSPSQVKAAISQQMAKYVSALKARDSKMVEEIIRANFAPEFKDVGVKGKTMNLEETIGQMKMNVSVLKSVKFASFTIKSVKVAGDKATTNEFFKLDALIQIPNDPKAHTLKVNSNWTGTYVKKNGRWWCTNSKTIKETALIDGKKQG